MPWRNLKGEFNVLHTQALALKREARALRPTLRLLVARSPIDRFASRVDELSEQFFQADSRLSAAASVPGDINGRISEAAAYSIAASAREAVRSLLHECYADVNDLRNQLNNIVSLTLAVVAIVVSVIAMAFGGG